MKTTHMYVNFHFKSSVQRNLRGGGGGKVVLIDGSCSRAAAPDILFLREHHFRLRQNLLPPLQPEIIGDV
jgi:hypothetical protein